VASLREGVGYLLVACSLSPNVEVVMDDELLRQAKRMVMTTENALKSRDEEKWHTRRVPHQVIVPDWACRGTDGIRFDFGTFAVPYITQGHAHYTPEYLLEIAQHAPYQTGDLCWIAEPYQIKEEPSLPDGKRHIVMGLYGDQSHFCVTLTEQETAKFRRRKFPYRYSAGRFMYKSLARTIVEIKRVWAEQVQDISEEDAKAEGCKLYCKDSDCIPGKCCNTHRMSFRSLWDSINKARGFGWDVNPWVYAYEYELVKKLR
jgi:hypothetical protein